MTTYARNVNNVAVDVTTTNPATIFYPSIAAEFIVVPDGTEGGATYENGIWTNPPTPPVPPVRYSVLTPMQFYLAFTTAERIAIKASTDTNVKEFWATYELAAQLNETIDPNLVSVQEGLDYLSVTDVAGTTSPYILPARIPQILQGIAQ